MDLSEPEGIILTLERYEYKPGETIKGNVTLKLEKPTKARKLEVAFIGDRIEKQPGKDAHGNPHMCDVHVIFYEFKIELDGKKEYLEGTYPFEIKIPLDAKPKQDSLEGFADDVHASHNPEGKFAKLLIAAKKAQLTVKGNPSWPVEWTVKAQLDIPLKFDLSANQKITLS